MISSITRSTLLSIPLIFLTFSFSNAMEINDSGTSLTLTTDSETNLSLSGKTEGIRHKRVALFNINVYKAKLYVDPEFVTVKNASKILALKSKAIKITPMRSFSGKKLKEAMVVSYEKNSVDPTTKAQVEFLSLISANKIKKNQIVYLIGHEGKNQDQLFLVMSSLKKKIQGPKGFLKDVFSVWLGNPVDGDMEKLQNILIN